MSRLKSRGGLTASCFSLVVCLWLLSSVAPLSGDEAWPRAGHFFMPVLAFSSDSRYLALGGSVGPAADVCPEPNCQGRLHLWDLQTGKRVFANESAFARVTSVAFSHDSRYIVSGHTDGTVLVWSVTDVQVVTRISCCSASLVRALALSPDDKVLAIGAQNGSLVLWNLSDEIARRSTVHVWRSLGGHNYGVSSLVFDATGEYLISSADDQHVRRWNVTTGAMYEFHRGREPSKAHRGMVKTVVTLANGRRALSGAYWEGGTTKDYLSVAPPDQVLRLWDVDTGRALRSYPLTWGVRCCIQVLNGHNLVAFLKATGWDEAPVFQIFNLDSGAVEREFHPAMGESFHAMAMHPNARLFLIALGDGHFEFWDLRSGKLIAQLVSVDEGWAVAGPDGRMDFSDGFRRWPCRHNIQQACAGGRDISPARGLLSELLGRP